MSRVPARRIWQPLAGFILWAAAFVALYVLQALGCQFGWNTIQLGPVDLHRMLLIIGFAVVGGGLVTTVLRLRRASAGPEPTAFLRVVGFYAALAALGAGLLTFAPVLWVSACV